MTTITENNPHLGSGLPAENWQRGYDGLRFIGYRNSLAYGFYQEGVAARKAATTTENNVAAQAGDEPILPRPACTYADHSYPAFNKRQMIEYGEQRYQAGLASAQVSPRATADVERVATECMEALAIGYVEFDEDLDEKVCADCSTPIGSEWGDHAPDCLVVRARAAIATTKPGA